MPSRLLLCALIAGLPLETFAQVQQQNTTPIGVPMPQRLPDTQQAPAAPQQRPAASQPAAAPQAQGQTQGQQAPATAGSIRVRAGEHPTYTRLVFDFPQAVPYTAESQGRNASLRFESPTAIDLGNLARRPPRWVEGLTARTENGGSSVGFTMPEGASLKHWRDGGKVVVDVGAPQAAAAQTPAAQAPAQAQQAPQAQAPQAQAPQAQAAPQTSAPAAAQRPPAAQATAPAPAPAPAPQAAAAPPQAPVAQPVRPAAPAPAPAPAQQAPVQQAPAQQAPAQQQPPAQQTATSRPGGNGVPAAAPVQPVQAMAPDGSLMPPPLSGQPSGDPLVPVVDASRSGPLLVFPFTRAVGAAAFMRNGHLWMVFDRPYVVDLRPITTRDWNGQINDVMQLPVPGMTVLRFAVPSSTSATFSRRNAGWSVSLINQDNITPTAAPAEPEAGQNQGHGQNSGDGQAAAPAASAPAAMPGATRPPVIDVRRLLDNEGGAKLFFAANDPAQPVRLIDPDVGDTLTVVPYAGANGGVPERREFVELAVLPSFQGFAFEARAENLDVRRYPRGIEIASANGLALSAPRGADPRRAGNEIFDYNTWRNVDGNTELEKRQNLQYRLAMLPASQRQAARLALAQFYFAENLHAEALGVLNRARMEAPDIERDKRFRAMRGVSNLMLGRLNDAANDLDSRLFDDDPDVLAYRGLLAAQRDDWPSARKAYSLAGGAVARFPADIRGGLRLSMARAWLSGGDMAGAEAELAALSGDVLSRGQEAEAHYVRGLLAQAQNRPDQAIQSFDMAIASGDRKARAYAEYAKTEFMLARKLIDTPQAIEKLDSLRFAWRGDPYEFNLLRRLGELQFASGDLRNGIATFRQIVKYFPKSADVPLLTKQMSDEFARLFLDGGAQSLPPLAALALYYDYRELTPPGPDGDEIIGKLADRLVGVDLLNRAAELLEHQIQYRLRGEDRARAGARLAVVDLLDRKPEAALKALQGTDAQGLSGNLVQERRLLQVRALADLDRFSEALNLLANDQSPDARGLRADIHWRAKDWVAAARVMGQNLGNRFTDPAPLSVDERKQVLQWAVALSMTNDAAGLEDLRKKYQDKMRGTPDAEAFNAIAATIARGAGDPRELASAIAQIGQYEAFMSRYRERVSRGGITAIN